jgi:hypothetical protein
VVSGGQMSAAAQQNRGRSAMNKHLLIPGRPQGWGGRNEGMKNKLLIHLLRAPSEQKTAGVDPQRVTFVSPKVTKSIAAGFQRSYASLCSSTLVKNYFLQRELLYAADAGRRGAAGRHLEIAQLLCGIPPRKMVSALASCVALPSASMQSSHISLWSGASNGGVGAVLARRC